MWISNDNISVTAEEDVFKVILRWVNRNKLVRKKYFPELFSEVRLVYVSREFLYSDVMTSEFVISDEHSVGLVKDALKVIESKDFQQRSIRPRKSLEMPVMVICVRGFSKQEDNMLCCYYPLEDKWSNVSVKSKLQHAPPGQPPRHLTFLKIIVQIPPYLGQNAVQIPHTRVHSGDQMPPPWGHFTGTKMTEERRKRLQLSNKIFTNITKTEKHC